MTNVSGSPKKVSTRRTLFDLGERALASAGWSIERIAGIGKSSVRRIVKGDERYTVSIRTTQDCYIAFPRNENDSGWATLDDVDYVVAVTVDDKDDPKEGRAYMVEGDEMRERFDRTYKARTDAGHSIPLGRGVWLSMFVPEDPAAPSTVGGGIAIGREPILTAKLDSPANPTLGDQVPSQPQPQDAPLTIAEAKRRLASSLGVEPDKVKIVIEA